MSRGLARPYAAALFQLNAQRPTPELRGLEGQLAQVEELFLQLPKLRHALLVPTVPVSKKAELLATLGEGLHLDQQVRRLLAALLRHGRLGMLADVAAAFRAMVDGREGMVRGRLESPVPLDAAALTDVQGVLARRLGCRVELETVVREELLAGFVVRLGSLLIDGSMRNQLRRFVATAAGRE